MIKHFISTFLFICLAYSGYAAHIIGGEITYRCMGNNNYEFTMKIYRDCFGQGADFDSNPGATTTASITIFRGSNLSVAKEQTN